MTTASCLPIRARFSALALMAVLLLGACAGARDEARPEPVAANSETTAIEFAPPAEPAVPVASTPVDLADPGMSCRTDADCAIKDVGSCCGYNPRCVNKDSPTFPEQVKAQCAKSGRVGICGHPSISSCACNDGKCAGVAGAGEVVH